VNPTSRRLRFGAFELDVDGGRLLRDGRPVKIQPQPLRVLTALVERPGEVVSRDDLRGRIWDRATFVEFDQGLNFSIRQIRVALEDDAASPVFVETVKKQGYRFVAAVTAEGAPADVSPAPPPAAPPPTVAVSSRPLSTYVIAATFGVVLIVATGAWLSTRFAASGAPARPPMPVPRQLTDFADSAVGPALSPDGRLLAFIRGKKDFLTPDQIYVKMLPDGAATRLTDDPRMKYGLTFSPDGSEVAYTVMEDAGWSTYAVPVLGGLPRLVLRNAAGLTWLDRGHVLFSEVKQGQHMGIVTAPETRVGERELYFPSHERGMAHYAEASPDRTSALVVEMDGNGAWQQCRLISIDGAFASRQVGPAGACRSAAWSPDGAFAYFAANVEGESHIWRQRMPDGTPEQITSGVTTEVGLAVDPDGRSLVTSMGVGQTTMWMHNASGEHQLSSEGDVLHLSAYGTGGEYVYYLVKHESGDDQPELRRLRLTTGQSEPLLSGISVRDFDISPDGTQIVYVAPASGSGPRVWIAPLDRSGPPKAIGLAGDRAPLFGPDGDVLFCFTQGTFNYLGRMHADGTGRTQVVPYPVSNVTGISPGRTWVMAIAPLLDRTTVAVMAIPVSGGAPVRICEDYCLTSWSTDGRFLFASVEEPSLTSPGRSLAIPIGPGEALPALPLLGIAPRSPASAIPGARSVPRADIVPGADPDTFFYVATGMHRNLFRVPLPPSR